MKIFMGGFFMKKLLVLFSSLLLLGACAPAPVANPQPATNTNALSTEIAGNIFATQTASVPTAPPTPKPTDTLAPTNAPKPTATPEATATPQLTATPQPSATPQPTPTPTNPPLEVLGMQLIPDSFGYTFAIGEVVNNSSVPYHDVIPKITFTDNSGNVVGSMEGFTLRRVIPPGEKSPFDAGTSGQEQKTFPGATDFHVTVEGTPGGALTSGILIKDAASYVDSRGNFHVKGQVQNTRTSTTGFVSIIVTLYSPGGSVFGDMLGFRLLSAMPPLSTSPFDVSKDFYFKPVDHFAVVAEETLH